MRPIAHPALDEIALPYVLYALSDPIRLQIVRRLKYLAQSCDKA